MRNTSSFIMYCRMVGHGMQAVVQGMECRQWTVLVSVLSCVWQICSAIYAVEEAVAHGCTK